MTIITARCTVCKHLVPRSMMETLETAVRRHVFRAHPGAWKPGDRTAKFYTRVAIKFGETKEGEA